MDVNDGIPERLNLGESRLAPGERMVYVLPLDSIAPEAVDDRSLVSMLRTLWMRRWLIIVISAFVLFVAIGYVLLAPKYYRAEVLIMPAGSGGRDGLGGQLAGLGGLASLAGIELGGSNTAEPVATLKSPGFARAFVDGQNLLPVLFADRWSGADKSWIEKDPDRQPDLEDGVRLFERRVRSIEEDKKTGLVTLAVEWTDPQLAADWANQMVDHLNARMRDRAITEASANLDYLQQQLQSSQVVEMKAPLGRLVEGEMQKLMLAKGRPDFAFRVLDKAAPPKWQSRPKRLRTILLAALLGPMLAVMAVLAWHVLTDFVVPDRPRPSL